MEISNHDGQGVQAMGKEASSGAEMASEASEPPDIPSRPLSRLGFNEPTLAIASGPNPMAATLGPHTSPNESMDLPTERTSVPQTPSSTSPALAGITAVSGGKVSPSSQVKGQSAVTSPSSRSVGGSPNTPSSAPRKPTTSVSRLCFPFVTTSPRRKKVPAPPPPPRHKHSCFPTKFAPYEAGRPAPVHERHKYHHHGHSRLALEHMKSLWSLREDEWKLETSNNNEKASANTLSRPVGDVHPTTHPGSTHIPDPKVTHGTPAPMSIHPRRGDVSALRDSYCVDVDRSFINVPTWTISKTLWMHDLHLAFEKRRPYLTIILDDDASDVESELEMEMSRSTTYSSYSEDSDATLFDSETEYDSFDAERLSVKLRNLSSTSASSIVSPMTSPLPSRDFTMKGSWLSSSIVEDALTHHPALTTRPVWSTNWYQRWEVIKGHALRLPVRPDKHVSPALHFGPIKTFNIRRPTLTVSQSLTQHRTSAPTTPIT